MTSNSQSPQPTRRRQLSVDDYVSGVLQGDRAVLARAITLIESNAADHAPQALEVLGRLVPHSGGALRVGITGAPGAGKSTLINTLGRRLITSGHKVAVLAVDPSSIVTRGSILGDKTRMSDLCQDEQAFIRPSPTAGSLGGVARKTRESMLLCEAAGYDVVLVETVGVGQSEVTVRSMVDFFLLLVLPGAGDELQGLKKGVVELADALAVTKADGDNVQRAQKAADQYRSALHYLAPTAGGWIVGIHTCSAITGEGVDALWETVLRHHQQGRDSGSLDQQRRDQALDWMRSLIAQRLDQAFYEHPKVASLLPEMERAVREGTLPPSAAAARLFDVSKKG